MSELKRKTALNIGFNGIAVVTVNALQFLASIVLARLLLPTDYGIVGFAFIFFNFMVQLSDFGIGSALIQKADLSDDLIYTGFTLKAVASVVVFLSLFSLAPAALLFTESREVVSALRMLSFGFLLSIPALLPQVLLTRELRYKALAYPQVIGAAASSFCAVALAYSGFGFRSIIAGYLINSAVIAAILTLIRPVRPRLRFVKESARHLCTFGSHLFVPGVVTFLIFNIDNFAIGSLKGAESLGYYAMAFNLGSLVCVLLGGIVHQVLFPTLSQLQHDVTAMKAAYLESVRYVAFVAVPVNLFLAVLGKEVLYHLLGGDTGRWLPALSALQVLCLYGVFRALLEPLANVITGMGKPRLFIRTSMLVAALQLILLYPALRLWGIEGVAAAVTVSYVSQYFICVSLLRREINVSVAEVWGVVRPALLAFLFALPVVLFLKIGVESSLTLLGAEILSGAAIYFVIYGMLTRWQLVKEVWGMVRPSRQTP